MTFYGLADYRLADSELGELVEFYSSREEAENALAEVLQDEPGFASFLRVVVIDLDRASATLN
jgi:hypothetical protein